MFRLVRFLKGYRKECIVGPLFKLLEACFELIVPLIMAKIIDIGIRDEDTTYIIKMGILLVLFGILGFACSITAQYFAAKAALGFGTALRSEMFAHINRLSHSEIDSHGIPSLITRMTSDINQAQTGVNLVLRLFLRSPFIVAGAIIMSFSIHVKLALILLAAATILAFVIYLVMSRTIPYYKKIQQGVDQVALITRENLMGVRVIRAFSRQKEEEARFQENAEKLMDTQIHASKISSLLNPMTSILVNVGIIMILWFGGVTVDLGGITQGEVIALVSYMTQILLSMFVVANLIINFTKASASAIRINDVFDTKVGIIENTIEQKEIRSNPKVVFDNVTFSYHGEVPSLSDIDFMAMPGETIGIIGGTGSGKSTLINLIPRFYDVEKGSIKVDGIDVKEYPFRQLRKKIGMVPQQTVLFHGTIRENMKWGDKEATDDDIYCALSIAQGKEFVDGNSEGLDFMLQQGGKNLSGGQRQRLTIARALVSKPEILILDDSASALDFITDAKLRKAIRSEVKNTTVFLVSQRTGTIRNADKIIVLEDGLIAGIGTHEVLLKTCSVYQEICSSQEMLKKEGAGI